MKDTLDGNAISDIGRYNAEMAKSLIDKIYFLDKVDASMFVDFGCADGTMLAFVAKLFPDLVLVGYDADEAMMETARSVHGEDRIVFTSDWAIVEKMRREHTASGGKTCLVLSSVIHEMHSYMEDEALNEAFAKIWGDGGEGFDYVAVRDMMVSRAASRAADPLAVARIRQVFGSRNRGKLEQWEARWGSLIENWSLIHFLLTYRYIHNWDREVRENYLPVNTEDFLASVPANMVPIYMDHFTLPFLRRRVAEDFGLDIPDATHLKVVFENRHIAGMKA